MTNRNNKAQWLLSVSLIIALVITSCQTSSEKEPQTPSSPNPTTPISQNPPPPTPEEVKRAPRLIEATFNISPSTQINCLNYQEGEWAPSCPDPEIQKVRDLLVFVQGELDLARSLGIDTIGIQVDTEATGFADAPPIVENSNLEREIKQELMKRILPSGMYYKDYNQGLACLRAIYISEYILHYIKNQIKTDLLTINPPTGACVIVDKQGPEYRGAQLKITVKFPVYNDSNIPAIRRYAADNKIMISIGQ